MASGHDISSNDAEFLESVFDRAVERIEDDRPLTVSDLLAGREHLRPRVEEILALARQVAIGPKPTLPSIRGYTLLGELGRGGMGTVFLARQERLGGRPVALKVLPPMAALSAQARERFQDEARAIAKLRHPNIVAVHDVVEDHGVYAYAMELVDGPSLAQVIDDARDQGAKGSRDRAETEQPPYGDPSRAVLSPDRAADGPVVNAMLPRGTSGSVVASLGPSVPRSLDPSGVSRLGVSIARALGAVHAAGLLHRDVKPSNILLRRDGTPLLSDFGLVRETDATVTQPGRFAGTPAYAPPEQLRGDIDRIDARSDVYALGVTIYHALALVPPFKGTDPAALLRQIEAGRAVPLRKVNPKLPRDLETIVAKAMDPDPARRYPSADDLADDLERLLNLQPIKARPAGLTTRTLKLVRRKRGAFVASVVSAVAALALAAAGVVYWFLVPGWIAGHVANARLALLDPAYREQIYIELHLADDRSRVWSYRSADRDAALADALKAYDWALRWTVMRPDANGLRLERDTVALAAAIAGAVDAPPGESTALRRSAAITCGAGAAWARPSGAVDLSDEVLADASPDDLRCLGLLAFLCGRADICNRAWSRGGFDLADEPDPLVDASLGQLYLELDRPALALPRLERAFRAFPHAGFLCVDLASAAVGAGDLALAERLLARAEKLGRLDRFNTLKRVRADYHARRALDPSNRHADVDAARARGLYDWMLLHHESPTAKCNYATFLESNGSPREALRVLGQLVNLRPTIRKYREALVGTADRWWLGLTAEERWRHVRSALDENPFAPNSFVGLLRTYVEATKRLSDEATEGKEQVTPRPSWLPGFVPSWLPLRLFDFSIFRLFSAALAPPNVAPSLQRVTLTQLAHILEVNDMARWSKVASYPRILKEMQFWAWHVGWPASASRTIDSIHEAGIALRRACGLVVVCSLLGTCVDSVSGSPCAWVSRSTNGPAPSPRYGHAMAYDAGRGVVVLFGGWTGSQYSNETWEFDPISGVWSLRSTSGPSPRYLHSMVYDEARAVTLLFGGGAWPNADSQTWQWDGSLWTLKISPGDAPSPRSAHCITYDSIRQVAVLFGGRTPGGQPYSPLGDTWEWDGITWTQVHPPDPSGMNAPRPRFQASLTFALDNRTAVLFGGSTADTTFDGETWTWDGQIQSWSRVLAAGPTARTAHSMEYALSRGEVVLFGGYDGAMSNESWVYSAGQWAEIFSDGPAARYLAATAYDSTHSTMLLFGGSNNSILGDLWVYSVCTPCPDDPDCNTNGTADDCDIAEGTSADCDTNGVPDECQTDDYDGDGLIDPCDPDMDNDGVANAADVCDFTPPGATVQPDGTLRSDIDGDCDVDLADHAIMAEEFTGPRT